MSTKNLENTYGGIQCSTVHTSATMTLHPTKSMAVEKSLNLKT